MSDAKLVGANLTNADLHGGTMANADLRQANLSGAKLYGYVLVDSEAGYFYFPGTNLSGSNLSGANLTDADFSGPNYDGPTPRILAGRISPSLTHAARSSPMPCHPITASPTSSEQTGTSPALIFCPVHRCSSAIMTVTSKSRSTTTC